MNNWLVIHRQSNLIVNVFEGCKPERIADQHKLIEVSELVLNKYFETLAKHKDGTCVDAGEFSLISPSFKEALQAS
ncbi:hypothetical protein D3C76_415430 [compost metagenome]